MRFVCNDCDSLVPESEAIIDSFDDGILFFCESCFNKLKDEEEIGE